MSETFLKMKTEKSLSCRTLGHSCQGPEGQFLGRVQITRL